MYIHIYTVYFNSLNELKEDKFNNNLSATRKTKSEADVHNNRSIKQKPNHPTNDSTIKHNTKVSKKLSSQWKLFILSQTQKLHLLTRKNGGAGTTKEEPRKELSLKVVWLLTYHPIN